MNKQTLEHTSDEEQLRIFSLEETQERPLQLLKSGCSQVGVCCFSQLTRDRTKGNDVKLHQGRFILNIIKISSQKGLSGIGTGFPGHGEKKQHVDVALEVMVSGEHGDGEFIVSSPS